MSLELVPLGPEDVESIHHLYRRWERHWNIPFMTSPEEILEYLAAPDLVPDLDVRGVWSGDRLAAVGVVSHTRSGTRLEKAFLEGRVDPACRGSGIGRRLLAWQIERAVEKLRECDPSLPWYVRTEEYEWVTDAHHLYARFGLKATRWYEDLLRPLSEPLEVTASDGVEIMPWDAVPLEETRRVSNASFADHWGSTPRDADTWNHLIASSAMRTDLSYVAVADGRVVGICLNAHFPSDRALTGRLDGWISHLGVLRDWRRRGVASGLVARSLDAFREAGFSHAMIGVDAGNPSGASDLYRKLGFQPLSRSITSELRVLPRTH